ncbi:transposase [Rhodococcus ruber]|uniref:transposase n=1 Tax=Rhodococcus ruber TaxID=1830 RepID=UPI003B2247C2
MYECGGVRPRSTPPPSGRFLALEEREFMADGVRDGWTMTAIATCLGRAVSTISQELKRHKYSRSQDKPHQAERDARKAARRPKKDKLELTPLLRGRVQALLELDYSPEQISATLRKEFPHSPEMHVSHETIYQSLYVQSKGGLTKELTRHLRTGRPVRLAHRRTTEQRSKTRDGQHLRTARRGRRRNVPAIGRVI